MELAAGIRCYLLPLPAQTGAYKQDTSAGPGGIVQSDNLAINRSVIAQDDPV
jgi:hypothetical protein